VYTPVDVARERIYLCKEWQSTYIPELEDYYDRYMLPEIVNPLFRISSQNLVCFSTHLKGSYPFTMARLSVLVHTK